MLYILIFALALVISLVLTPVVKLATLKLGIIALPNDERWHKRSIPLLGGVAIFSSFNLVVILGLRGFPNSPTLNFQLLGLLIGGAFIFLLGLADDLKGTYPKLKVTGQIIGALILVFFGLRIRVISNPYLSVPLTILGVFGMTNAFNFLDNMDGLSAGIATICLIGFFLFFLEYGQIPLAIISLVLAGATLGFLKCNFPSARIFMGDCGSMFLGFIIAALVLMGSWNHNPGLDFRVLIPILILGVPIFDTAFVSMDRIVHGISPAHGGKDHTSHRLVSLGLRPKRAVLFLYAVSLALLLAAYAISHTTIQIALLILGFLIAAVFLFALKLTRVEVYGKQA